MVQHSRADDDNGRWNGSAPWWMKAIYQVGVPSAIALYLIYNLVNNMPVRAEMPTKTDFQQMNDSLRTHVMSTQWDLEEVKRILLATCLNQASNDIQRLGCLGKAGVTK